MISEIRISGLTSDSRRVEPGFLFAALPGSRSDGRAFIGDAVRRGAAAVLASPGAGGIEAPPGSPPPLLLIDDNPRRRFALMAAAFYRRQPATVAAVTGTNGKTSVVSFLRQIWLATGTPGASLGTLGLVAPGIARPGNLTTPDPVDLHRMLAELADAGVQHLAMEASSHGLAQHRLDGVRIAVAGFTTLGRDHLDYHGSMEAYAAAKRRLFGELVAEGGAVVLNADDPLSEELAGAAVRRGVRVLSYGRSGQDLRLLRLETNPTGQRLTVASDRDVWRISLPLVGDFQAANALCAVLMAVAAGTDAKAGMAALETLEGVPGRMQPVARRAHGATIYVDYAHTPDALAAALAALRPHVAGRLILVFGCGGDRDAGKRPEMGRIAAQQADHVIVTDDNPRSEQAAAIRRQILDACPGAREIGDRADAISQAVAGLDPGDVLLIAGKGHETGQTVGDRVIPFDDAAVAADAVRRTDR
ncbi:MAG: UDP-N-acetylmuramoyl-L-alanyl-D-glutamate--2,6-diaminopimelate ligase [Rhodospirillales bacterium]|nr:MAG: UDP-N-acetylmuramoyl-L-alanyl-D-glutamate--2,6-diaminopimelate ligase [Rhodospirillales bacterium]